MSPIKVNSISSQNVPSVADKVLKAEGEKALEAIKQKPTAIGAIRDKWLELGGEKGFLGQPQTNELKTHDGMGRYNHFQGGSIYWTKATGAHEVHGAIRDKWVSLGSERSFLGYPVSDEGDFSEGGGSASFRTARSTGGRTSAPSS